MGTAFLRGGGKHPVALLSLIGVLLFWFAPASLLPCEAGNLPGGSYAKSCRNCSLQGNTLRCECSYKGKYQATSIAVEPCKENTIWNDKGTLKCDQKQFRWYPVPGAYQPFKHCRNCTMSGTVLTCECPVRPKTFKASSVDLNTCDSACICFKDYKLQCVSCTVGRWE